MPSTGQPTAAKIGAQAVQLQPYFMLCRAYYGVALEFSGRLEQALEQYQIGGVVTQGLPWMRALEGTCLVKLGRRSDARAVLNELLARRHTEYINSYAIARLRHALGDVDADDYHRMDRGFLLRRTGWRWGDYDYDNVVGINDYALMDSAFAALNPAAGAAMIEQHTLAFGDAYVTALNNVPEPGAASVLAVGAAGLLRRRRRRS